MKRFVPALTWIPRYPRADFPRDIQAGLTTAVMLIPQGMAYAMLAGLPPILGLYASFVPLAIYALMGTSRELAVGPVAMISLLVAQGVGSVANGVEEYVAFAVLLALMVGVTQLLLGLFRLGFLVNFLSHPVISGFSSAAALIIGFSQLKHLLGVDIPRSSNIFTVLGNAWNAHSEWSFPTLAIGAASIAALIVLKRWKPAFPRALAVVVGGTVAVVAMSLGGEVVSIVGEVPSGLPTPALPTLISDGLRSGDWTPLTSAISTLAPMALVISLVGFMESISVAKAFARRARYEVDPNQELVALGAANVAGSFFSAYPVTGGFSRTAVNSQAGAKSGLASLVTAVVIGLTLLWLTPLFYSLPKAVLAAIIMTAVFGLVDLHEVKHLWVVKRIDLGLLVLTFVSTLALGIEEGILIGVGASLLVFVIRTTRPHVAVLGRLPGTATYRNVERYAEAQTLEGVLIVRIDAQLYFGNVSFLKQTLARLESTGLHVVILDASGMNQLDSSAEAALAEIAASYHERGIALYLSGLKGPVRDVLRRSGLWEQLADHVTPDVQSAVDRLPTPQAA